MIEKFITYFSFIFISGILIIFVSYLPIFLSLFLSSFFILDLNLLKELTKTALNFFCYLILFIVYLFVTSKIIKYSFQHFELIVKTVTTSKSETENKQQLKATGKIFRFMIENLIFLFLSVILYFYFLNDNNNTYLFLSLKLPLLVYCCWILGFIASFPINKEIIQQLNTNNELRDYILLKSFVNTLIFLILYFIIKHTFFV